jgi:hypothetical protein
MVRALLILHSLLLLPKHLRCKDVELCSLLPGILWQTCLKTDLT